MLYWIWLSTIKYVNPILQKQLLKDFSAPKDVFEAGKSELEQVEGMTKLAANSLLTNRSLAQAKEILELVRVKDIKLCCYNDPRYPPQVRDNPDSPILFYYYGNLPVEDEYVAIVGLKECTPYGKQVSIDLTTKLSAFGIPVLCDYDSGTGYYVRQTCLHKNGSTLAFTAYGLDLCFSSKRNKRILENIIENGAVISPNPPMTIPKAHHYKKRNALISSWAKHIVIIEAEDQDDSLLIAEIARQLDRKLYVVPNQINIKTARGTNALLAEGATPYIGIESLKIVRTMDDDQSELWDWTLRKNQREILFLLNQTPLPISILAPKLNTDDYTLMDQLFTMEQEGKVHIRGGMVYKL